ncbi:MAG: DOMON-like domain-containing protein, partial [Sphingomonas sp.]
LERLVRGKSHRMSDTATGPRPSPGMRKWLVPHPVFPSIGIIAIGVEIARDDAILSLRYTVEGDLDRVLWPQPMMPARTDELWMHTCFEAFIQPAGQTGYTEVNLSPSGRWATYQFDGYRDGMRDAATIPVLNWQSPTLTASVELADMAQADWRLGLTVVVEAIDGSKSFWALDHHGEAPDFHNADCFVASLPAPERA